MYSDLVADPAYRSKYAGAALEVVIANEDSPSELIIGATTGQNLSEDYETIPIEEVGNDGVDEQAQGRHSGTLSIPAFWTPEWNDTLPTRQTFVGKSYFIYVRIAPGRPQAGTVVNAYIGCRLSRIGMSFGARGAQTLDLAFAFTRRYNGAEWALLNGG